MAKPIPKHMLEKLARLYYGTKGKDFTPDRAREILKVSRSYAGQILPTLVKTGWLTSKRLDGDRRRKVYSFNEPKKVIEDIGQELEEKNLNQFNK